MCYGSGCSKENHMGDCTCFFVKDERKMIEESEYKSECLIFGSEPVVEDFYLSIEEYLKIEWLISENNLDEINRIKNLAFERWREDEERLKLIEQLEVGNKCL